MLRMDGMDGMNHFSPEFQRAAADLTIGTTSGALGGFLIPPGHRSLHAVAAEDESVHGSRARSLGSHPIPMTETSPSRSWIGLPMREKAWLREPTRRLKPISH